MITTLCMAAGEIPMELDSKQHYKRTATDTIFSKVVMAEDVLPRLYIHR